jgi:threonine synthase
MMNGLHALGVRSVVEDSSGNGGASVAAYSAAGGIECEIFVPAGTSPGKIRQAEAYGAILREVVGSRDETATAAQVRSVSSGKVYASHNWQPLFLDGIKTVAYELWEQLGFCAPDNVIAPAGFGSNVIGLYRGFGDLVRSGAITKIPHIFAVQASNCAPIFSAWKGTREAQPSPTIAEGIATRTPVRLPEILDAVRYSGGGVVAVTETEIAAAMTELGALGLYVEPTGAVAAAGLRQLSRAGYVVSGDTTVVLLTGVGLKTTDVAVP